MAEQENSENVSPASPDAVVPAENSAECCSAQSCCCADGVPADAETEAGPQEIQTENGEEPKEPPKFRERVRKPITADMLERTQKDLMKMFDFLGYDDAVVRPSEDNGDISLAVESEEAGRIIGRKGQTLESIQLLLNRMMQKDDPDFPRIQIVIDGYSSRHPDSRGHGRGGSFSEEAPRADFKGGRRDARRSSGGGGRRKHFAADEENGEHGGDGRETILRQQALDAAKEVRRWGDPKTLPPMNAHDRRIIHITLEKEADLLTESEGDGPKKSIVISLKKS